MTASISGVTKDVDAVTGVCNASDYTLTNAVMDVNAQVPTGTAQGAWGVPADVATLAFNNKATNQDQCKGARVKPRIRDSLTDQLDRRVGRAKALPTRFHASSLQRMTCPLQRPSAHGTPGHPLHVHPPWSGAYGTG